MLCLTLDLEDYRYEEVAVPRPGPGEVLVKVNMYIKHYTIPMNDIFNLNSTILPENLEVFYSTLSCQP